MISTWGQGQVALLMGLGCVINCINWLGIKGHEAAAVVGAVVFVRAQEICGCAMLLCHPGIIKIPSLQLLRN